MKKLFKPKGLSTTLLITVFSTTPALANSNCISGQAAEAGYNNAYDSAKEEIDTLHDSESSVSSEWSKCLGSISASVGTPTFPNLSDVWEQITQTACKVARSAVDEQLSSVNSTIDEVYSQVSTSTAVSVSGSTGVNRSNSSVSTSDYYSSIWQ